MKTTQPARGGLLGSTHRVALVGSVAVVLIMTGLLQLGKSGGQDIDDGHSPSHHHPVAQQSALSVKEVASDDGSTPSLALRALPSGNGRDDTPAVECALSLNAREVKVWNRLATRCPFCTASPKPFFCDDSFEARDRSSLRHDFSRVVEHSKVAKPHQKLSVVYSALGQRFFGPGGQSYVLDAIRQWRLFHAPDISDVYLIVDDNMTTVKEIAGAAVEYHVALVTRSSIMTPEWSRYAQVFYIQGYMHPGGSRSTGHRHFNQLVSERFYALHGLMRTMRLQHVLHFENDNMVYGDMRPVVAAADQCGYRLASTFANNKHVIPGVLYIRDEESIGKLCAFINDFLSCGEEYGRRFTKRRKDYANDMTYMMTFYQLYGSEALGALPAWEHKAGENCMAELLWNRSTAAPLGILDEGEEGAIFDLASFGQWYSFSVGGERPPLHVANGVKGRFLDATPPPRMYWKRDVDGRQSPMWKKLKLLSLHVHAKNLDKFRSDRGH